MLPEPTGQASKRPRRSSTLSRLDGLLSQTCFILIALVLLISPWLFGAWEAWWFWMFVCILFLAVLTGALQVTLGGRTLDRLRIPLPGMGTVALIGLGVFLLYALVRMGQTPVSMDAERSVLLLMTPAVLAFLVIFCLRRSQLRMLTAAVGGNLVLLGVYGIVNHQVTGSRRVLWVLSEYTQYAGRASGSYFCPDHFSGVMELLLAVGLALVIEGGPRFSLGLRACGLLMAGIALDGIWISQSRGGILTAGLILALAAWMGTSRWTTAWRWSVRPVLAAAAVAAVCMIWQSRPPAVDRFREYLPTQAGETVSNRSAARTILRRLEDSTRGQMYSAAVRAWRDIDPWFGIGPGMHQHVWFHYAASPDGDRERGIWPTHPNEGYHSFEVHSDWLQLLEEYGIMGVLLFLVPAVLVVAILFRGWTGRMAPFPAAAALLAAAAMAFHSLGDFNLQIPATSWMLACVMAIPLAWIHRGGYDS